MDGTSCSCVSPSLSFAPIVPPLRIQGYYSDRLLAIETWLEDAVIGTEVTVTAAPSVTLDTINRRMTVQGFAFAVRGITVGLSELRVTCDGSTTVALVGELDLFGKYPKFYCNLHLDYDEVTGGLFVADIEDGSISVAGFAPSLSESDLTTIVDVVNEIIDRAGGLPVTSDGAFEGVGIEGTELVVHWTGSDSTFTSEQIETKLNGMADALAAKATAYLAVGEGQWTIGVNVVSGTSLDIDAVFTALGVTASLDASVTFDTLTATITDATLSVGSRSVTFSAVGVIGCSGEVPSVAPYVAMESLTLGDEYPGLQSFVADVQEALLDAIDQAIDAIVTSTGLAWTFCPTSIAVVGSEVVLTSPTTGLIVGDVNLDGRVTMADVLTILQYRAGAITLGNDQLRCADTNADERVTMADGLHIMQFRADPYGTLDILSKPLYDPVFHEGMIDPLTLL